MFNLFKCKHPFASLEAIDKADFRYLENSTNQVFKLQCTKCGTKLELEYNLKDQGRIRKTASKKPTRITNV